MANEYTYSNIFKTYKKETKDDFLNIWKSFKFINENFSISIQQKELKKEILDELYKVLINDEFDKEIFKSKFEHFTHVLEAN